MTTLLHSPARSSSRWSWCPGGSGPRAAWSLWPTGAQFLLFYLYFGLSRRRLPSSMSFLFGHFFRENKCTNPFLTRLNVHIYSEANKQTKKKHSFNPLLKFCSCVVITLSGSCGSQRIYLDDVLAVFLFKFRCKRKSVGIVRRRLRHLVSVIF